jgi:hypothetical protein
VGGFFLKTPDLSIPIPLDAEQIFYLVKNHYIDYPILSKDDIADRNKADGLARFSHSQNSKTQMTDRIQATHNLPSSLVCDQYHCATDTRLEHDNFGIDNDIFRYCHVCDILLLAS